MGASDLADSARLAGIMTVFGWPQFIDLNQYIVWGTHRYTVEASQYTLNRYVRHPLDKTGYDFSRDQFACLIAGLRAQGQEHNVHTEWVTGKDLLWMISGHIKRCKGLKASWFDDMKLWAQVIDHAKRTPLDESNQLLCQLMIADKKFLRKWCELNVNWRTSIGLYWRGWRGEPELAAHMIKGVERHLI